jgi:uncharacterized protein
MRFIWDEAKRKSNLIKHGLDFADVARMFELPILLSEDGRNDYGEQRMLALGILDAVVVVVVHVESDETIRIISMPILPDAGGKYEANLYFEEIGRT